MRIVALLLFAAALVPGAVLNAPVAGKWSGTIDVHDRNSGDDISTPVEIQIDTPHDSAVSGKIGREGEQPVSIQNGKLEGNHISFEASSGETSGAMKFDLTINGNKIDGLMKGSVESLDIEGVVKLVRATN